MASEPDKPKSAVSPASLIGAAIAVLLLAVGILFLNHIWSAQRRSEARIEELERELAETRDQIRATGKVLIDLWTRLDAEAAEPTDPAELTVTPVPELDAKRSDGVVIQADNRHRVYVVSLGSMHGIKLGQRIQILRNDEYVTDIVIDSVQPTASAGTIAKNRPAREIREKDRAVPLD